MKSQVSDDLNPAAFKKWQNEREINDK